MFLNMRIRSVIFSIELNRLTERLIDIKDILRLPC